METCTRSIVLVGRRHDDRQGAGCLPYRLRLQRASRSLPREPAAEFRVCVGCRWEYTVRHRLPSLRGVADGLPGRSVVNKAAQLAGFLAAHAVLQAAKGATLGPLIIFEKSDGTAHFVRIHEADPQLAASKGEQILKANADGAERGVMAFDAYLNLPQGRTDAIFLQAWQYVPQPQRILLAVPYRHASKPGGFAVHRPTVIAFEDERIPDADVVAAFFLGVDKHEAGGKFWQEHYDESY